MILLPFYSHSTDDSTPILLEILIPAADDSTPILRIFSIPFLVHCWDLWINSTDACAGFSPTYQRVRKMASEKPTAEKPTVGYTVGYLPWHGPNGFVGVIKVCVWLRRVLSSSYLFLSLIFLE